MRPNSTVHCGEGKEGHGQGMQVKPDSELATRRCSARSLQHSSGVFAISGLYSSTDAESSCFSREVCKQMLRKARTESGGWGVRWP